MRLTYYTYFLEKNGERYFFDLNSVLSNFTQLDNPALKKSFHDSSNQLFLFQRTQSVYLFISTSDDATIKAINNQDIKHTDIAERLMQNEQIGFVSYIYAGRDYYGIATSYKAPKNKRWVDFVNLLLKRLDKSEYVFYSAPVTALKTREEVMEMDYIGKTIFEVDTTNDLGRSLMALFGGDINEYVGLEIKIKPDKTNGLKNTFKEMCETLKDRGLIKYLVSAKENLDDNLQEFYIIGSGYLSDFIKQESESDICQQVIDSIQKNYLLQEKVTEFRQDERLLGYAPQEISVFYEFDLWGRTVFNYSQAAPADYSEIME